MDIQSLIATMRVFGAAAYKRFREDDRGDVLQTVVLVLGFFLLATIVVGVIVAAVNSRTAQIQ
jgi:hypothetical protein